MRDPLLAPIPVWWGTLGHLRSLPSAVSQRHVGSPRPGNNSGSRKMPVSSSNGVRSWTRDSDQVGAGGCLFVPWIPCLSG